jgi:protein-tyrosine kinase
MTSTVGNYGSGYTPPLYTTEADMPTWEVSQEDLGEQNIVGFDNNDPRVRPFKMLRTQVAKRVTDGNLKILGVTSAAPNVGKTFVSANLAASLSRIAGIHVCCLDLDLHRPALGPRFGVINGHAVHDYLSGEVREIREVGRRINDENFVLIPGFRRDVATGELLTSPRGDALFAGLRALPPSTVVIVDMPPIFADDDAVIIGHRIDGFLIVVEDGKTTRKQVQETIRMLEPTPLVGTVLNRYKQQLFQDEYGYGHSYGYGAYY